MGIYFRDSLLIQICRGVNNCVHCVFKKNIYFMMISPSQFNFLLSIERLDFCDKKKKIKRIKGAIELKTVFTFRSSKRGQQRKWQIMEINLMFQAVQRM